jgi:hypothetical protein
LSIFLKGVDTTNQFWSDLGIFGIPHWSKIVRSGANLPELRQVDEQPQGTTSVNFRAAASLGPFLHGFYECQVIIR